MDKPIVAVGEWFSYRACPDCHQCLTDADIYDRALCPACGHNGGNNMIAYDKIACRYVWTSKPSLLQRLFKGQKEEKHVEIKSIVKFGGGSRSSITSLGRIGGMNTITAAAAISIL